MDMDTNSLVEYIKPLNPKMLNFFLLDVGCYRKPFKVVGILLMIYLNVNIV